MALSLTFDQALDIWRGAVFESVRGDMPDLTSRQMAVILLVYMEAPPHTVRGLARELAVAKPAITRALDRLEGLGLVRRLADPDDRRSLLVGRTVAGSVYLRDMADRIIASCGAERGVARP